MSSGKGNLEFEIDAELYCQEVVESALYVHSNLFVGELLAKKSGKFVVKICPRDIEKISFAESKELFLISLTEQNLKQRTAERTSQLRDLIMAHAFSKADLDDVS